MKTIAKLSVLTILLLSSASILGADVKPQTKANYDKQCARCHGPDGKGQTRMGRQAGAKDYTDPQVQAKIDDERAFKSIKEGLKVNGKEAMKPFGDKLSDQEIKDLIAYMRAFAKK